MSCVHGNIHFLSVLGLRGFQTDIRSMICLRQYQFFCFSFILSGEQVLHTSQLIKKYVLLRFRSCGNFVLCGRFTGFLMDLPSPIYDIRSRWNILEAFSLIQTSDVRPPRGYQIWLSKWLSNFLLLTVYSQF